MNTPSNTPTNAMPESFDAQRVAPSVLPVTRPMYWSLRRELWEYRSIYIVPLGAAAVVLFGFLISLIGLPHKMRALSALDPLKQQEALAMPYDIAAGMIMVAALIVGFFYSLDALYGERRDRSILFWKSLPVSDLTTVLSKASIPLVVLPLLAFGITVITQLIMLLLSTVVLLASGQNVGTLWTQLSPFQMSLMLFYHLLTVHVLCHAPFYCWLLLVSAWAKRAPFLWAVLPPLAIGVVEKLAFNTSHFANMLMNRLSGGGEEAVAMPGSPLSPMTHLTPGTFVTSPGLWIGLVIAAASLAGAVALRRYREPI